MSRWEVCDLTGTVEELHGLHPAPDANRQVWLMAPQDTALVLGSSQPDDLIGEELGDIKVVRRRSGGGAVLVSPRDVVWIDVIIGRRDSLWDDDVNRAARWLGLVWVEALASMGIASEMAPDRYEPGLWGKQVCFASRGSGEVLMEGEGAKVVGVSQKRTRSTARFQTLLYRRWEPEELIACLAVPSSEIGGLRAALAMVQPVDVSAMDIQSAFLAALG